MILNITHSFINIFAGGRHEIKVFLFLLYLALLIAIYIYLRNQPMKMHKWKWLSFGLLFAYLYGFALHIFYIISNGFSLKDFILTGNNGEISSSTIWHTHIAKGFIGQILHLFDKTNIETMDAGGAYINLLPSFLFFIGSLLLLLVIAQTIIYFSSSFKEILSNKNKRQKIFLILGYTITSFSMLKTFIDGGILNPALGVTIIFITLFFLREKGKSIIQYYYFSFLISTALLFINMYIDTYRYGNGTHLAYIASLSLLYTFILYGSEKKIRKEYFYALLLLFLSSWWIASIRDRNIWNYQNTILEQGQNIYIYNAVLKEVETSKIEEEKTIRQLSKELGKNITYVPVSVPGVTCMSKAPHQRFSLTLATKEKIPTKYFLPLKEMRIKNLESVSVGKNWHTVLDVSVDPCLPEPLSVLNGELIKNNINTYFLINPIFYDSTND